MAFSPDGKRLATGGGAATQIWDASTGKALLTLAGQAGTTFSVAFSPDGTRVAAGRMDKTAKVWDVGTGQVLFTLSGHGGIIYSVAFSPDGKRLTTASADATVKVWDVSSAKELSKDPLTLTGHAGAITGSSSARMDGDWQRRARTEHRASMPWPLKTWWR